MIILYACSLHVTIMCIHIHIYICFFPKQGLSHWSQVSHKDNTSHHRVRELLPSFLPQAPGVPSWPIPAEVGWVFGRWTAFPQGLHLVQNQSGLDHLKVIMELTGLPNFPTKSVCVRVCVCVQSIFLVEWGDTTHDKPWKWHICAFTSELSGRYSSLNPTKRLSTISKWAVHVGFGFAWSPWCWKQKEQKDVVLGWPAFAGFACWRHQIPILEPGFCVGQCPAWNNWLFHPATELSQGIASVCTFHYICSILQVMPTIKQPNFNLCWNWQQVL